MQKILWFKVDEITYRILELVVPMVVFGIILAPITYPLYICDRIINHKKYKEQEQKYKEYEELCKKNEEENKKLREIKHSYKDPIKKCMT